MTKGQLPQRAGLPGLNGGGAATAVLPHRSIKLLHLQQLTQSPWHIWKFLANVTCAGNICKKTCKFDFHKWHRMLYSGTHMATVGMKGTNTALLWNKYRDKYLRNRRRRRWRRADDAAESERQPCVHIDLPPHDRCQWSTDARRPPQRWHSAPALWSSAALALLL